MLSHEVTILWEIASKVLEGADKMTYSMRAIYNGRCDTSM